MYFDYLIIIIEDLMSNPFLNRLTANLKQTLHMKMKFSTSGHVPRVNVSQVLVINDHTNTTYKPPPTEGQVVVALFELGQVLDLFLLVCQHTL